MISQVLHAQYVCTIYDDTNFTTKLDTKRLWAKFGYLTLTQVHNTLCVVYSKYTIRYVWYTASIQYVMYGIQQVYKTLWTELQVPTVNYNQVIRTSIDGTSHVGRILT